MNPRGPDQAGHKLVPGVASRLFHHEAAPQMVDYVKTEIMSGVPVRRPRVTQTTHDFNHRSFSSLPTIGGLAM
jgi:hypothetical protein